MVIERGFVSGEIFTIGVEQAHPGFCILDVAAGLGRIVPDDGVTTCEGNTAGAKASGANNYRFTSISIYLFEEVHAAMHELLFRETTSAPPCACSS